MAIKTSFGVQQLFSTRGIEELEETLATAERTAARLGADMPSLWNCDIEADGLIARLHAWLPLPGEAAAEHVVFSLSFLLSGSQGPRTSKGGHRCCRFVIVDGVFSTVQEHPLPDGP